MPSNSVVLKLRIILIRGQTVQKRGTLKDS